MSEEFLSWLQKSARKEFLFLLHCVHLQCDIYTVTSASIYYHIINSEQQLNGLRRFIVVLMLFFFFALYMLVIEQHVILWMGFKRYVDFFVQRAGSF